MSFCYKTSEWCLFPIETDVKPCTRGPEVQVKNVWASISPKSRISVIPCITFCSRPYVNEIEMETRQPSISTHFPLDLSVQKGCEAQNRTLHFNNCSNKNACNFTFVSNVISLLLIEYNSNGFDMTQCFDEPCNAQMYFYYKHSAI